MTRILLIAAASALLATSASAAPMIDKTLVSPMPVTENVRRVCDEYGRCYRTRGPRYVQRRYYDDTYAYDRRGYVEPSYGYRSPGYGYGYGGGPSIGFSFGGGRW